LPTAHQRFLRCIFGLGYAHQGRRYPQHRREMPGYQGLKSFLVLARLHWLHLWSLKLHDATRFLADCSPRLWLLEKTLHL
jgi:hypothetical protein